MKITNRQYVHLAWLFENPTKLYCDHFDYFYSKYLDVEFALINKGLVKIVEYDNHNYRRGMEWVKEGELTKEEFEEYMENDLYFRNTDKVWAYRQWMTHEEYAEMNLKLWEWKNKNVNDLNPRRCVGDWGCSGDCNHPLPLSYDPRNKEKFDITQDNQTNRVNYTSLTEEGLVEVIKKFGLKSDSELVVYPPEMFEGRVAQGSKWRVEWEESSTIEKITRKEIWM